MIRLVGQVGLLVALLVATVMLIVQAYGLLEIPTVPEIPLVTSPPVSATNNKAVLVQHPSLIAFSRTVAEPIFFEGRAYPVPDAPLPEPPPPPPQPMPIVSADQFRLLGIVSHGTQRRALIEGPSAPLDWYTEGADLQGWTLHRIEPDSIQLRFGIDHAKLELFRDAQ